MEIYKKMLQNENCIKLKYQNAVNKQLTQNLQRNPNHDLSKLTEILKFNLIFK